MNQLSDTSSVNGTNQFSYEYAAKQQLETQNRQRKAALRKAGLQLLLYGILLIVLGVVIWVVLSSLSSTTT